MEREEFFRRVEEVRAEGLDPIHLDFICCGWLSHSWLSNCESQDHNHAEAEKLLAAVKDLLGTD